MKLALRWLVIAWAIIFFVAWLMSLGEKIGPTNYPIIRQVAAGVFLVAVVCLFVVEAGWLGGNKNNASHM